MHVHHVGLVDFRSYENVSFDLEPGITTFVGANGQGKTNIVEAVGYVATLGSHRVASDAPLVRQHCERAIVRVDAHTSARDVVVEIEIAPGRTNRARINRGPVSRSRDVLGLVNVVVFAPEDLALVKGDPAERRRFLDDLMYQLSPRMAGVRSDYDRVLKQRNALLKSAGIARRSATAELIRTLEVWDLQLASLGAQITCARDALVAALAPLAAQAYAAVADSALFEVTYDPSIALPDHATEDQVVAVILGELERRRNDELDRGITLVGPHRDDVALAVGGLPVKGYASHGESWSASLALRLGSYDLIESSVSDPPILVLDDVFAELDSTRRSRLAELVIKAPQVLITAAVGADVPDGLVGARFDVVKGSVTRG